MRPWRKHAERRVFGPIRALSQGLIAPWCCLSLRSMLGRRVPADRSPSAFWTPTMTRHVHSTLGSAQGSDQARTHVGPLIEHALNYWRLLSAESAGLLKNLCSTSA